jgi:hypothetical protein
MRRKLTLKILIAVVAALFNVSATPAHAAGKKSVEFGDVVKLIESHYRVKHRSVSMLERVGVKAGQVVARHYVRYAEYGSVKYATFEDQDFTSPAGGVEFYSAMSSRLQPDWQPLVQVLAPKDGEQTYIYTREAGKLFRLLVVTIGRRDATAVQLEIAPQKLVMLMRDPDAMGKTLTDEAAGDAGEQ